MPRGFCAAQGHADAASTAGCCRRRIQVMSTALQMAMSYDEEEHKELHASGTGAFHIGSSGAMSAAGVAERILDKLAIAIPSKCVATFSGWPIPCAHSQ